MKTITRLYKKIFDIGVRDELTFSEKLRINLCNQCIALASTLTIVHIIIIIIEPSSPYELKISSCWLVIFAASLYANYRHRYTLANFLIIAGATFMIGGIHFLYGSMVRLEPIYLTIIIIAYFIINSKYHIFTIIAVILIYCLNSYLYVNNIGAPLEEYLVPEASYEYFAFSIIVSGSLISKVILENNNYNKVLAIQNKKMAEQNEELMRFNYIISHDLKEPIRSIVALTGLLKKKIKINEVTDIPDEIISLGIRLNNMIDDIVKFQELDKMKVSSETFSLSQLLQNIESSLPDDLRNKNYKTSISGLDKIHTSKTCVYIIIKNLVENGIKYNNNEPIINISCQKILEDFHITIKDNGIGIPEKFQEEIFVMFKRLNYKSFEKGTGLGLSISKKLAQKYGAQLDIIDSNVETGSSFRLIMPSN